MKICLNGVMLLTLGLNMAAMAQTPPTDFGPRVISLEDAQWKLKFDNSAKRGERGADTGWQAVGYDDSDWESIRVGEPWEHQGHSRDGVGWYRCTLTVPKAWKGRPVMLALGRPDDAGELYFNGKSIDMIKKFGPHFHVEVPEELIKFGEPNLIAVRVWDWYRNGGLNAGRFALETFAPLSQQKPDPKRPREVSLGLTDNLPDAVVSDGGWAPGWRDGGTSDTRPKLDVARKAFKGQDAIVMDVWYPNSSEYIDVQLPEGLSGSDWSGKGFEYLAFNVRSPDTQGELTVMLTKGQHRWGRNVTRYAARVDLEEGGHWQRVVLPWSAFTRVPPPTREPRQTLSDPSFADTLAIGYGNHHLQGPGKFHFADFRVGRFDRQASEEPINLGGLWRFKLDNQRPGGSPSQFNQKDDQGQRDRIGYGLDQGWHTQEFDDREWRLLQLGRAWETQGINYNGPAWYRQRVWVPRAWEGRKLNLNLGKPDDRGEVYLNGEQIINVEKYGGYFQATLKPQHVRYGDWNTLAIRIYDWYRQGGVHGDALSLSPQTANLTMAWAGEPDSVKSPTEFEMGAKPGKPVALSLQLPAGFSDASSLVLDYRIISAFHRTIAHGQRPVKTHSDQPFDATISLTPEQTEQLFYSEYFTLAATLTDERGRVVFARRWVDQQLRYDQRDALALPALPEQYEQTPYGKLKLVDVIDAAANPASIEQPYKEGGIRRSWVGRRAYATWEQGVTVESFKDKQYREVNNNEFFGYRIGRGQLQPNKAYLLRILVPDNKKRYVPMDIKAGRNYQGTGYANGLTEHPLLNNYPLSNEYQWYDHLVVNDTITYGWQGARQVSSENGFWVFFHDNGRVYSALYEAGPAVAEMRLYEIPNVKAHAPNIRYPKGLPRRVMMMDWEREPETTPGDAVMWAQFAGITHLAPTIQKWASGGYWDTELGFKAPHWHQVGRPGEYENHEVYQQWLKGTRDTGIKLVPRVEYGGGPQLPKSARVIGPDGKIDRAGRYASWGANILAPETWTELKTMVDEILGREHANNPQLAGLYWRQRQDRIKPSYGKADVELFCKETGMQMPEGDAKTIAQWASKTVGDQYHQWWHDKLSAFIMRARDLIQSYDPNYVLYYYHWDEDGWSLLPKFNAINTPQDWSDVYNVDRAHLFYQRRFDRFKQFDNQHFVDQVTKNPQVHRNLPTEPFKDQKDVVLFAPVSGKYIEDNPLYFDHFQTGDGLGISLGYHYEEKGRWNVHSDNYETSEMGPGGRDFAMAEEVVAFYHGDPNVITATTYTWGRGWIDQHRAFAQAFLALPDMQGQTIEESVPKHEADVRVRMYDPKDGRVFLSVVSKAMTPLSFEVKVPLNQVVKVVDLVTGQDVEFTQQGGALQFALDSPPMSLHSFMVQRKQ